MEASFALRCLQMAIGYPVLLKLPLTRENEVRMMPTCQNCHKKWSSYYGFIIPIFILIQIFLNVPILPMIIIFLSITACVIGGYPSIIKLSNKPEINGLSFRNQAQFCPRIKVSFESLMRGLTTSYKD